MTIFKNGVQSTKCDLKLLNKLMKKREIVIDLYLNSGKYRYTVLTSDLTHEYIHINSVYTT